jgi:aspartate 1-decarboxylase
MLRSFLRSKIHRAVVTHVDKEYEGSITIPPYVMKIADIDEFESVEVWNITNGNRFQTYAIMGASSNEFAVNGAAAHLCSAGDLIIIASFGFLNADQKNAHMPSVVFMNSDNTVKETGKEIPGPQKRGSSGE